MGKRNGKNKNRKIIIGILTAVVLIVLGYVGMNQNILNDVSQLVGLNLSFQQQAKTAADDTQKIDFVSQDDLNIYFFDVGQADCILVMHQDKTMLIDAGKNEDGDKVVDFIKEKGITKLDYVIGTHPHEDHIGGLDDVILAFDIEQLYMPKIQTNTKTFEDVLDAIETKGMKVQSLQKDDNFQIGESKATVMTDAILDNKNLNVASNIIKLEFGNHSFLFTGDAESKNEKSIDTWEKVTLLKVGHHGSNTSSSNNFIKQIQPQYAVIMVGKNNSYKLPTQKVLDRLKDVNSTIYRTDEQGTIKVISDGNDLKVETEK